MLDATKRDGNENENENDREKWADITQRDAQHTHTQEAHTHIMRCCENPSNS